MTYMIILNFMKDLRFNLMIFHCGLELKMGKEGYRERERERERKKIERHRERE